MTQWLSKAQREAPVTLLLCSAMIAIYLVTAVQSQSFLHNIEYSSLAENWVLYYPQMLVESWGWVRAITGAFIHIGPVHLGLNTIALFLFGREVEKGLGSVALFNAFLAGALGSSAAVIWFAPESPTAGASGAVYALMTLYVVVALRRRLEIRGLLVLIVVNILFTLMWSEVISVWGHFGGLAVGIALAIVTWVIRQKGVLNVAYILVCATCLGAVFWRLGLLSTTAPVLTTL